ncbi:MAG: phosphoglucosamine mutase [Chlorobi bacterium]|nr:phosphoglucosamine mutase [Chlorobiota bacterium]
MTLIKSISGIRGTIGGRPGDNLTPLDAVQFAAAFVRLLREQKKDEPLRIVLGRDARPSGEMIARAVKAALTGAGADVIDLDLTTTPTLEMAVPALEADGGIILTASHNPVEWNALKLLDRHGEFISADAGRRLLEIIDRGEFEFVPVDELGQSQSYPGGFIPEHVDAILKLPETDAPAIARRGFRVVVDAVNSTGGLAVPALLEALEVEYVCLYCRPDGKFPHNPEPLEAHLQDIMRAVPALEADLGIVVDPDADRLALIDEKGRMFGEEYTLVAAADYILSRKKGPVVSNLSSSRALKDLADRYGVPYYASPVGEVNVVKKMKETGAVIGGEGNGGVIYPDLHYGRDALAGIALILSLLADRNISLSELKNQYPAYYMAKEKIRLEPGMNPDELLERFARLHADKPVNREDGVKVEWPHGWVHLRKSNTEPVIRIYTEAATPEDARALARTALDQLKHKME